MDMVKKINDVKKLLIIKDDRLGQFRYACVSLVLKNTSWFHYSTISCL